MSTSTGSPNDGTQSEMDTSPSEQSPTYELPAIGNIEDGSGDVPSVPVRLAAINDKGFRKIPTEPSHIALAFTLNLLGLLLVMDQNAASPLYKVAALFHAPGAFVSIIAYILAIMRAQATAVFFLMLISMLLAFAGAVCIGQAAQAWLEIFAPWIVGGNAVAVVGRYVHLVFMKKGERDHL